MIMNFASFSSPKAFVACLLLLVLATTTSAQNNTRCPFNLLYHFGDGVFDSGNAIRRSEYPLPAAKLPYGETYPGKPSGRWSDGRLDIDYGAQGLGFPKITAYLSRKSSSANAVMLGVARSPMLSKSFFKKRGIRIPSFAAPLDIQMHWFKKHIHGISSTPQDISNRLANSLVLFGDVEANDITYPLIQGKSIKEVKGYIKHVTQVQINAATEAIKMGARRVILPGNAPMGCYPFILTELASNNPADYDDIGCLKPINDLIVLKNNDLQNAIGKLRLAYPNVFLGYADFYNNELTLIRETLSGPNGTHALQACCGIGGKYNYNKRKFCGSRGVPICSDPSKYFFWDGIHLTQEANNRLSTVLAAAALPTLNCTAS